MTVGNLPNPPTAGQPVATAWGNAVSVRVVQAYATRAALEAGWTDAPEGAHAVTLDDLRMFQRRSGQWAPPLWAVMGAYVKPQAYDANTNHTTPGGWQPERELGTYLLYVDRLYMFSWSARWELVGGVAPPGIIGGDVVATGTGDDVAVESGGVGQQILVFGQTLKALNDAWRGSVTGFFHTVASAGQGPGHQRPVTVLHRIIGGGNNQWSCSMRRWSIIDMGPWP